MKNIITISTVITALIFFTACTPLFGDKGLLHNQTNAYKKAKNGRDLRVPRSMSTAKLSQTFVIPAGTHQATHVPPPPGSLLAKNMYQQSHSSSSKK